MKIEVGYFVRYRKGFRNSIGLVIKTYDTGPKRTHYLDVMDTRTNETVSLRIEQVTDVRKKL